MIEILLVLALVALVLVLIPGLRSKLADWVFDKKGTAMAKAGLTRPKDLQREAIRQIKDGALVFASARHIQGACRIFLSETDLESIDGLKSTFEREIEDEINRLEEPNPRTREPSIFVIPEPVKVSVMLDERLRAGQVKVVARMPAKTMAWLQQAGEEGAYELMVREPGGQTTVHRLKSQNLLGRDIKSDIVLDYPQISRNHATIVIVPDRITIRDLGSSNGTLVNGELIENRAEVTVDDMISFGPISAKIRVVPGSEGAAFADPEQDAKAMGAKPPDRDETIPISRHPTDPTPSMAEITES